MADLCVVFVCVVCVCLCMLISKCGLCVYDSVDVCVNVGV